MAGKANFTIKRGFCPCGQPSVVSVTRNGYTILYRFVTCTVHGKGCPTTKSAKLVSTSVVE